MLCTEQLLHYERLTRPAQLASEPDSGGDH